MNLVLFGGGVGYNVTDWIRPEIEVQYGDIAGRLNRGVVSTYAFGNMLSASGGLLGSWKCLGLGLGACYQHSGYAETAPQEAQDQSVSGTGAYGKIQASFGWLVLRSVLRLDPSGEIWFGVGGGGDTAGLFSIL